jgi:hypothetical protein
MADTITLNNVSSNAWEATSVNGTNISADTTVENPVINLSNIGTRYIFYNDGYSAHPLEFLDSNGDILLSQSGTGTFESDGSVNWVDNDTSVEFTLTTELSDQITQYRCTVHTAAMAGSISSPQTVDYTPSTGSVSITSPDNSSTVVNPFPVSMGATNFVIESASNGVSDGAGHFHLLVDQPAVTAGEVIPNNPSNGYYHYGDGSTSTELDLSTGEHTIRLQAGDANHRAYNLTDSIGVTVTTVSGSIDTLAKPDKGTPNWHVPLNDNFSKLETSSGSINSTSDGVQIDNPVTNDPFVKFNVSNDGSSNGTLVLANSSIDANNNSITNVDGISVDTLNADSFANNATESVQDIVGGLITGQNDANVTYDDTNDQLSIDVSTLTSEEVEDTVASFVKSDSNLSWSYDDTNDTLTVSLSDSISVNTLEASGGVENLPAPTTDGDAARKAYVDAVSRGLDIKESVRVTTAGANIDIGSSTDPSPIDGVTLNDGDRVLLKDQTDAVENGIYVASTATDPTTWTRSPDSNENNELNAGSFVFVEEGNTNLNRGFVLSTNEPFDVGVDAINFTQFSGVGQIVAGNGLGKTGDTFNIKTNAVQTDELDESILPTWTGDHTFNSTIKQQPNNDNSNDYLKVAEYQTESDLPSNADEGGIAYVQEEGTLYVEDGT